MQHNKMCSIKIYKAQFRKGKSKCLTLSGAIQEAIWVKSPELSREGCTPAESQGPVGRSLETGKETVLGRSKGAFNAQALKNFL